VQFGRKEKYDPRPKKLIEIEIGVILKKPFIYIYRTAVLVKLTD